MDFTTFQGDIADQAADTLVNAAGTSLKMGSGVAGALRRGAGDDINKEAISKAPVDLGDVAVTDAYNLDAKYVIHAAAMPHYGDGQATEASILDATQNTLEKADELGCESLVIPILGTGVAGFEFERGAELLCSVVADYEPSTLADVRLIAYDDEQYATLEAVANRV